jgi:hypothetical protein
MDDFKNVNDVISIPSPMGTSLKPGSDSKFDMSSNEQEKNAGLEEKSPIKFTLGEIQSHKVDKASLVVFPSSFLLFMIGYWNYYAT